MTGVRGVVSTKFQERWYRVFKHHCRDRCVWTSNTCRHSTEEVPSISVLSNSHSVINTNHGP